MAVYENVFKGPQKVKLYTMNSVEVAELYDSGNNLDRIDIFDKDENIEVVIYVLSFDNRSEIQIEMNIWNQNVLFYQHSKILDSDLETTCLFMTDFSGLLKYEIRDMLDEYLNYISDKEFVKKLNIPQKEGTTKRSGYTKQISRKKKHTYYYTCPMCGANLDPNEKCDCNIITEKEENNEGN